MRSDSVLYTGKTSQSERLERLKQAEVERKSEKAHKRAKLTPQADIIIELIQQEKQATVMNMMSLINTTTPQEQTNAVIASLNLYSNSLTNLSAKVKNILRESK